MKPQRRLVLAQVAPKLGDVGANLEMHREWAERAADDGAEIMVFPELSLTGYFLKDLVPEVAMSLDDPQLAPLLEISKRLDLVVGTVLRSTDFRYYNAALYMAGGEIRHVHRKVYLPTYGMFDEQRYFAPGDRVRRFDCGEHLQAGLLVCEDMWHFSTTYLLFVQGVHVVVCISSSPGRGVLSSTAPGEDLRSSQTWDDMCRTVAEYTSSYVVYVNRLGYEDGVNFHGGSTVHGPDGRLLLSMDEAEGVDGVELDLREVQRQRVATPLLRDEKVDFTLRELESVWDERISEAY